MRGRAPRWRSRMHRGIPAAKRVQGLKRRMHRGHRDGGRRIPDAAAGLRSTPKAHAIGAAIDEDFVPGESGRWASSTSEYSGEMSHIGIAAAIGRLGVRGLGEALVGRERKARAFGDDDDVAARIRVSHAAQCNGKVRRRRRVREANRRRRARIPRLPHPQPDPPLDRRHYPGFSGPRGYPALRRKRARTLGATRLTSSSSSTTGAPSPRSPRGCRCSANARRFRLIRHERNVGFVASVNEGMGMHRSRDVLLLNSDTEVADGWLDRIAACAASRCQRTATVTPFSNNATICSYPLFARTTRCPTGQTTASLDRVFARENAGASVEIPTAVGFCMYISRRLLDRDRPLRRRSVRRRATARKWTSACARRARVPQPALRRHVRLPRRRSLLRIERNRPAREGTGHRRFALSRIPAHARRVPAG